MFFDQPHEVGGGVAGERRLGEVGIGGEEVLRTGVQVCEIAAAATRDQYLLADSICAFKHHDATSALAGFDGAHQAGSACSENDDVVSLNRIRRILIHAEVIRPGTSLTKRAWPLRGLVC